MLKLFGIGLGYVFLYLVSKHTGAAGVGFYQVHLQVLTVLGMILGLGLNTSVLRYAGQFNNEANRSKMHSLYRYFVSIVSPMTLLAGFIMYFGSAQIASIFGKGADYAEGIKLVGLILPFYTINQLSVEFIRGLKKLHISELIRSVIRPLVMISGILFYYGDQLRKLDILYLLVISLFINSLVSRLAIWKALKDIPKKQTNFSRKELMKTSYPMWLTGLSASLLVAMPVFFLDYFSTQAAVGIYGLAFGLASMVSMILMVVNTIAAPKFSALYWSGEKESLQTLLTQSTKLMFWVALMLTTILIIFGEQLLGLFGAEFKSGYQILVILSVGQLLNAATGSVGILMNMSGMQDALRSVIMLCTLSVFLLCAILLPFTSNSSMVVVVVTTFCNVIMNLYLVYIVQKRVQLKTYYTPFR